MPAESAMGDEDFAALQQVWFRRLTTCGAVTAAGFTALLAGLGTWLHVTVLLVGAAIVAPRMTRGAGWEALCARYDRSRVSRRVDALVASRRYALQAVFDELPVEPLLLADTEAAALRDWDAPSDVEKAGDG
jgi:hypothetical protein